MTRGSGLQAIRPAGPSGRSRPAGGDRPGAEEPPIRRDGAGRAGSGEWEWGVRKRRRSGDGPECARRPGPGRAGISAAGCRIMAVVRAVPGPGPAAGSSTAGPRCPLCHLAWPTTGGRQRAGRIPRADGLVWASTHAGRRRRRSRRAGDSLVVGALAGAVGVFRACVDGPAALGERRGPNRRRPRNSESSQRKEEAEQVAEGEGEKRAAGKQQQQQRGGTRVSE